MMMYAENAMTMPSVLVRIAAQNERPEATARPPIRMVEGLTRKLLTRRKRSGQRTVLSSSGIRSMAKPSMAPEWVRVAMASAGSMRRSILYIKTDGHRPPGFPVELDGAGEIHAPF